MDLPDHLRREARAAYEWGRMGWATWVAIPLALVLAASLWVGAPPTGAIALTIVAMVSSVAARWRGGDLARGVVPGLAAGLIPWSAAVLVRPMGHYCTSKMCLSWCVAACAAAGIASMLVMARAPAAKRTTGYWVSAGGTSALVGAIGCSCAGHSGIIAMLFGMAIGLTPAWLLRPRGVGA